MSSPSTPVIELKSYLQSRCAELNLGPIPDNVVTILEAHGVDNTILLDYDEADLEKMNIPSGFIKKLLRIISDDRERAAVLNRGASSSGKKNTLIDNWRAQLEGAGTEADRITLIEETARETGSTAASGDDVSGVEGRSDIDGRWRDLPAPGSKPPTHHDGMRGEIVMTVEQRREMLIGLTSSLQRNHETGIIDASNENDDDTAQRDNNNRNGNDDDDDDRTSRSPFQSAINNAPSAWPSTAAVASSNPGQKSRTSPVAEQLLTLQAQLNNNNNSLVLVSPFVKDKFYQIDFAANGITPPDPNAFGTLLKLPSQNNSALFQHVKNELWKKLGSMIPSPKSVSDFTLESIEVIYSDIAMLEGRMRRLQQLRTQNGNFFNPPTGAFTAEQLQTLIALRDQFLPRSSNATEKTPNLINVFHGTKVDRLQSVVNGLVAVRSTDAGYFGLGVYTTTSIEYAAKYATGEFLNNGPYPPRASDGCFPVVWCVAAVGVCYPLTREVDYSKKRVHDGMGVSDFFGAPLTPGYDCHCVAVNESVGFQAVPRKDMQYMEVVFDQEIQVLPIAVLWVKSL